MERRKRGKSSRVLTHNHRKLTNSHKKRGKSSRTSTRSHRKLTDSHRKMRKKQRGGYFKTQLACRKTASQHFLGCPACLLGYLSC
jgi:hypothetical protein